QQAREPHIQKVFLTREIDGRLREFAFSAAAAHTRADRVQGLILVFVLLTVAGVVYMSSSWAKDQEKEEEESILTQFLSPAIVEKLNTNPEVVERFYSQWLSVFFVAISGFRQAAETGAEDIEAVALRRRRVMDIVRRQTVVAYNGIVDKFMGDTVMGWIGGPFSAHWNRLASFRERLALDELAFVEQDIRSLTREIDLIERGQNTDPTNEAAEAGLPSGREERLAYLRDALRELEANQTALLEKQQAAKLEDPSLEARHDEAMQEYKKQAATSAVLCCLAIWEEVAHQESEDAFHDLSIGIASGSVSVGNFGSTDQIGFTVLGPTVDRAARLEPASAQCGCKLLIDLQTYELVKDAADLRFRLLPRIPVAGDSTPLATYEPFKGDTVSQDFLEAFHEGVFAAQRDELEKAITHFEQAQQLRDGGDAPSRLWIEACQAALQEGRKIEVKTIAK
ncbi:MAG: adenylate/guanylate cyclase domain-containing protein, partial [Candidatus Tectomicrobia bacterium]|nr:adenylate/guanylate cyclase domain-containing protein [Candidatus Tectomicrobia bacterium]